MIRSFSFFKDLWFLLTSRGSTHTYGMSSLQPTDNRNCVGVYSASDGESSDDEDEEALLVEKRRETGLRESPFYMCLSTLDE